MPKGDTRKIRSMEERFWSKVDREGPFPDPERYPGLGRCWIFKGGATLKTERSHLAGSEGRPARIVASRYSWAIHNGPPPDDQVVRHKCDNGHLNCVNPAHLELGTQRDNIRDYYRRGRVLRTGVGISTEQLEAARVLNGTHGAPLELIAQAMRVNPTNLKQRLGPRDTDNRVRPLTDEQLAFCARRTAEGASISTIADELGGTRDVVAKYMRRAGIEPNRQRRMWVTPELIAEGRRLVAAGMSVHGASKAVGVANNPRWRAAIRDAQTTPDT